MWIETTRGELINLEHVETMALGMDIFTKSIYKLVNMSIPIWFER